MIRKKKKKDSFNKIIFDYNEVIINFETNINNFIKDINISNIDYFIDYNYNYLLNSLSYNNTLIYNKLLKFQNKYLFKIFIHVFYILKTKNYKNFIVLFI